MNVRGLGKKLLQHIAGCRSGASPVPAPPVGPLADKAGPAERGGQSTLRPTLLAGSHLQLQCAPMQHRPSPRWQ